MKTVTFSHILRSVRDPSKVFNGKDLEVVLIMIRIMNSTKFRLLQKMYQHAMTGKVFIEGVEIWYEENEDNPCGNKRPAFTNMSGPKPGFHLFCDAGISRKELITTVAHELYRISNSVIRTNRGLGAGDPLEETRVAEAFSRRVAEFFQ